MSKGYAIDAKHKQDFEYLVEIKTKIDQQSHCTLPNLDSFYHLNRELKFSLMPNARKTLRASPDSILPFVSLEIFSHTDFSVGGVRIHGGF